jgi:excisionase family DNA binding protein
MKSSDIAKALHVSEQTVRAYAREGLIPFVETPGGHRRYVLEDVRTALARAKKRNFKPLDEGEAPRLADRAPAAALRRARRPFRSSARAMIAEAHAVERERQPIPFIGVKGSSRFVVGEGSKV